MNGIGLFAGRGDVILSMGLALIFGCWVGWKLCGMYQRLKLRLERRRQGVSQA